MEMLVLVVSLTIFISANCSWFEATLFSTRRAALEAEFVTGGRTVLASRFIQLKDNISVPIASILILNTVANTGGATIAGMYANEELGAAYMPLFSAGLTLAILFFSEIIPKTMGAVYWRNLWWLTVWPLIIINWILYPAVVLIQKVSDLMTRGRKAPAVTEDEILAVVRLGEREGEITDQESVLVHNMLAMENKEIKEIMTPRTVIFSLSADLPVHEAVKAVDRKGHTRIPLYEDDRENIIGYMIIHDLFSGETLSNPDISIGSLTKQISFVPETRNCLALLTTALAKREHIFIVVDEYGGVAGLITLEDLIETLLGDEIVDETDRVVDLQESARRRRRQRPST